MSIQVVKGPIRGEQRSQTQAVSSNPTSSQPQPVASQQAQTQLAASISSDAVVTLVRNSQTAQKVESVREFKSAKELARDVAKRLEDDRESRGRDSAGSEHAGLASGQGAKHLIGS